jgi:hypothetical protein
MSETIPQLARRSAEAHDEHEGIEGIDGARSSSINTVHVATSTALDI